MARLNPSLCAQNAIPNSHSRLRNGFAGTLALAVGSPRGRLLGPRDGSQWTGLSLTLYTVCLRPRADPRTDPSAPPPRPSRIISFLPVPMAGKGPVVVWLRSSHRLRPSPLSYCRIFPECGTPPPSRPAIADQSQSPRHLTHISHRQLPQQTLPYRPISPQSPPILHPQVMPLVHSLCSRRLLFLTAAAAEPSPQPPKPPPVRNPSIAPCLGACDPKDAHRPPTVSSAMPRRLNPPYFSVPTHLFLAEFHIPFSSERPPLTPPFFLSPFLAI